MQFRLLFTPTLLAIAGMLALGTGARLTAPPDVSAASLAADLAGIPRPRATGADAVIAFAPDSTVLAGSRVYGLKGTITGDSLLYQYYVNDTLKATGRRALTATVDSARSLPAPAYGATTTYKGLVIVLRGTAKYTVGSWVWPYTRGAAPLPSADSVQRLSAIRLPVMLARPVLVCPAGYSCAEGAAAPVTLPRYVFTRLGPGRDSLTPQRGMSRDPRGPQVLAPGVLYAGYYSYQDGQRLGLLVCVAAELADGRVVWTETSARMPECGLDGGDLFRQRYGARWAPSDPTAPGVEMTVAAGPAGLGIVVTQAGTGLSLSLGATTLALR